MRLLEEPFRTLRLVAHIISTILQENRGEITFDIGIRTAFKKQFDDLDVSMSRGCL
jgi:hypothetical protein